MKYLNFEFPSNSLNSVAANLLISGKNIYGSYKKTAMHWSATINTKNSKAVKNLKNLPVKDL